MKVSTLRMTLATTALAIGVGAACAVSAGTASASSTPARAGGHGHRCHHRFRPDPYEFLPKVPSFRLASTTVRNGHPLPRAQLSGIFGVPGGKDISPELSWSGFPAQTQSFVVAMYDPQAPTGSGMPRYIGGAPPAGSGVHDYYITVTALDEPATGLGATTSGALLGFEIDSHTIARATIICPTALP